MNPEQYPNGGYDNAGPPPPPPGYPAQPPQGHSQQQYQQQGHSYQQGYQQQGYQQQGYQQQGHQHAYAHHQYPQRPQLPLGWQAAGVDKRIFAGLIDGVVAGLLSIVIAGGVLALSIGGAVAVTPESGEANGGVVAFISIGILLFYVLAFAVPLFYRWYSHTKHGRTLGKKMLGTRVVDIQTGGLPRKGGTLGREVLFMFLGWIACLWILWEPNEQGLHDKAGKTAVVLG